MAIKMTSIAARWGGTVTYSDNSVKSFSAEIDPQGNKWSQDQAESFEASKQISWFKPFLYPYWTAIVAAIESLPLISNFDFASHPSVQKKVTNMIARLDAILAFNDNTHGTIGIVFNGNVNDLPVYDVILTSTNQDLATELAAISNSAEFRSKLKEMFQQAMDTVVLT